MNIEKEINAIKGGDVIREIRLNDVKIGARYGVTVALTNWEDYFRGNLINVFKNTNPHLVPAFGDDLWYVFDNVEKDGVMVEGNKTVPERWIVRIEEYDIGPDDDTNRIINTYVGGRRKKRTRRRRKRSRKRRKSRRKKRRKSRRKRKR